MSILQILVTLEATPSRNAKLKILQKEKDNKLLWRVIFAALNPYTNYFQKKIPEYVTSGYNRGLAESIEMLGDLSLRLRTGHDAVSFLKDILTNARADDAEVIERIIARDLKCGVNVSTVNKVYPGFIPTFEVMTCHKDITFITYPAYIQTKMDGARCHLYYDGVNATAFSRSGNEFHLHQKLNKSIAHWATPNQTLDGELLFFKDGKPLDRKTSNGLANKAVKGKLSEEEAEMVRFVVWDIVDYTSQIDYEVRFKELLDRAHKTRSADNKIILVEWKEVFSEEEAQEFYDQQIANGEEGAIAKNKKAKWVPKRTNDQGKMKAKESADLLVLGWERGTGKNKNRMGNLICGTRDGLLKTSVGTGFSDKDREELQDNVVGKIIEVKYNQLVRDKKGSLMSMFLPRFVVVRFDKKIANALDELK